jgi:hypothetical protein
MRKLGTFRHGGQLAAEYQHLGLLQVKIVPAICHNLTFAEAQIEDVFRFAPDWVWPGRATIRSPNWFATEVEGFLSPPRRGVSRASD